MQTSEAVDLAFLTDLDSYFGLSSGNDCLLQDLFHRLQTQDGDLARIDEDGAGYGTSVLQFVGKTMDANGLLGVCAAVQAEMLKDDRVQDCNVSGALDPLNSGATLTVVVVPLNGVQIDFVVSITDLGVELLDS